MFALDRSIKPFSLISPKVSSSERFSSKIFPSVSACVASLISVSDFVNWSISSINTFSLLFESFLFFVTYFIVSFLTVPLISSQIIVGFEPSLIKAISFILNSFLIFSV